VEFEPSFDAIDGGIGFASEVGKLGYSRDLVAAGEREKPNAARAAQLHPELIEGYR